MSLRTSLLGAARALALGAALAAGGVRAEPVRMSVDEARGAAAEALAAGQAELALVLVEGVLLGKPGDVPALMMKSRALTDLGRAEDAAATARIAFAAAEDGRDRFFSALLMAQARVAGGRPGTAQLWLRRAAQIAPDEDLRAVAVRDFRQVRRMTPWRLSLNASVEPSDNLNGAPKTNTFTFGGLPFVNPSAVPLSGQRAVLGADYLYRLPLSETRRLTFGAGFEAQRVRFSDAARRKVPGIDNADYRQDALKLSLGYEVRGQDGRWLASAQASATRHWLAGVPFADTARLDLRYGQALTEGVTGALRLGLERERRHDAALRDALTRELGVSLTRDFAWAALSLDLSASDTDSDSRLVARGTRRAALGLAMGKPVRGLLPRMTLAWERADYDMAPSTFWTDPRRDAEWSVSVDVLLPEIDYYGFAPEIGVSFRDRTSNYSIYETRGTDLRFGLKSVF